MGVREFAALVLEATAPLVLAVLTYVFARLSESVRARVNNRAFGEAVGAIGNVAAIEVANAMQTVKRDLLDPNKPGTWDDVSKAALKRAVSARVLSLVSTPAERLRASGLTDSHVQELVDAAVERAVLEIKTLTLPLHEAHEEDHP